MDQRIRFCSGANGRPIAYAVVGEGPPLVCATWWVSHLEHDWANPRFRAFFEALARDHAVVRYDRAGVGLSDRTRSAFSLAAERADFEALVTHLGYERFALFAQSAGAPVAIAFAAAHPDRVTRLVLYGAYARGALLAPPALQSAFTGLVRASWGLGSKFLADIFAPGVAPDDLEQIASFQRVACSAEMAAHLLAQTYGMDVGDDAQRVRAPTLVVHRRGDRAIRFEAGRDVATLVPGAELMVLEGDIHIPWFGDSDAIATPIRRFLAGQAARADDVGGVRPSTPVPVRGAAGGSPANGSFLRRGDVWEITFAAKTVHVKHGKGLADLAFLLGHAGSDVTAAYLAYPEAAGALPDARAAPMADPVALARYRERLAELDAELDGAEEWHDEGRRDRLAAEREALLDEVQRAAGLGGRPRAFGDERERARKAVSARIRQSIASIRAVHPELADHLDRHVTTGSSCRYAPEPPTRWET